MTNVTTLEQELDQTTAVKIPIENIGKVPTKRKVSTEDKSVVDKLTHDSNTKLNYYLRKTPQFQIVDKQINLLKDELEIYKKNGSKENYEKTKEIIVELTSKRTELKNIFKNGYSSTEESKIKRAEINTNIKNSVIITELKQKKKELLDKYQKSNSQWWCKEILDFRKRIETSNNFNNKIETIETIDDIIAGDSIDKKINLTNLEQNYYDFCGKVADLLNWDTQQVVDAKIATIKNALNLVLEDSASIKEKIRDVNIEITKEQDIVSNTAKLTDLIFASFDFEKDTTEGKVPKEILASANISFVKSVAYTQCLKFSSLNKIDDAISCGLEGLTKAINLWYETQKITDSALSFKGFASQYIYSSIERGLLELLGLGMKSGSIAANHSHFNKKEIDSFLKENPQFEDLDKTLLFEMLAPLNSNLNRNISVTTESDYSNQVSGDEGDSSDVWANATIDNKEDVSDMLEAKLEYEKLLSGIKDLLNLFETKKDKKTGLSAITDKKLFDKYDKKLFFMYFGLEHKIERNDAVGENSIVSNEYTQSDMGIELVALYNANGIYTDRFGKPLAFSQPAISARIETIINKLKSAMEFNPSLKAGFQYFYNYFLENQNALKTLSNNREEINMKIDRDELRDIYIDDEKALNTQLSDGKKLSDTFQISDNNPLDDEIASWFNEL